MPQCFAVTDGLSLRELYRDASAPNFCASDDARLLRLDLERAAIALEPPAAVSLLGTLAGFAEDLGPDAADLLQDCQARNLPRFFPPPLPFTCLLR